MQSIWEEIREGIMATLRSSTPAQFTALQEACPSLARFRDAIAVASWLITREDNGERNLAYRELVRVVQSSDTPPQLATTLLYSGLWAPLDHIYNDLQSELPNAKERASRVCSQFANQIKSMNLDNVNKVAATLVQNVRRDAWAELGKDWRESDQQLGDEVLLAVPATDQNSEDVVSDAESMLKILTAIWAIVGKRDAELLRLAYVVGQPHAVTAEQLGMTEAQVRQRVSRAIRKVQKNPQLGCHKRQGSSACTGRAGVPAPQEQLMETSKEERVSLVRLPGLFRRWELDRVIGVGVEFRVESAGIDCDGSEFFAVYRRERVRCLSDVIPPIVTGGAG